MSTKLITKITVSAALALALIPSQLKAAQINGGISFAGNFTPIAAGGTPTCDFCVATQLTFSAISVFDVNGDFAASGVIVGAPTTVSSITLVPLTAPAGALWTVAGTSGNFALTLTSISQDFIVCGSLSQIQLEGVGTITGPGFDPTPGTWIATFNSALGGSTCTYSMSFSSAAKPNNTPALTLECPPTSGQVGVPFIGALVASGGVPPYTFSITGGSLPPGLTLDTTTGAITGTPTMAGIFPFTAQVVDSSGTAAGTLAVQCNVTVIGVGGCRVTGGSNDQTNSWQSPCIKTTLPTKISHGGQLGAPYSVGTPFTPYSPCIWGEWQHNRHLNGNSLVGVLHATSNGSTHQYDSLLCACLPCPENPGASGVVGNLCNPGDRICGPEPRRAPADKLCFSGVGDYTFTKANKTVKAVFRVDIEDRSEGNSHASSLPPDRYRMRIWILDPSCGRSSNPDDASNMAIRYAASADPAQIGTLATTENLKVNIPPDIDDGGNMTQGNHQIHPQTGAVCGP